MKTVYFIVGPTASGKSTLEKNLRLRTCGSLPPGDHQESPDGKVCFVGPVVTPTGKKVKAFSGGDMQNTDLLYEAGEAGYEKIFFDRWKVNVGIIQRMQTLGYAIVVFHVSATVEEVKERISRRRRTCWNEFYDVNSAAAAQPAFPEWRAKRDAEYLDVGVQVTYLEGSLAERVAAVEAIAGLTPLRETVTLDFTGSPDDVVARFNQGD